MFKRMLVPLDGSRLAESVLPAALYFAERFGATLVLFHAIEQDAPATIHGQRHLLEAEEAKLYLGGIAERVARPGLPIEIDVHPTRETDVPRSIADHVAELNADLIVLCTHGGGGVRGLLVGSIAQQVIQHGTAPVLIIQPRQDENVSDQPYNCRKILVPLDSTPIHEPALPVAEEFARASGAGVHLLTVVPTAGTLSAERAGTGLLLPTTMAAVLDLAQRGAVEYLQSVAGGLSARGVRATAQVARGDVATCILDASDKTSADLIVMATHGRGNIDAFWSGSVTPKVLAHTPVPVLLVRVRGAEAAR